MREIKKLVLLTKADYYKKHLSLINCILPVTMTPKEMEVLAAFMSLEGDITQHRFGPSAKKIVMAQLNLSPSGLSNYIGTLTDKGFLIEKIDMLEIRPLLIPNPEEQTYHFKLQIIPDA